MPNIKLLIEETISIIKVGMCCKAELELDKVIKYEDILNMWNSVISEMSKDGTTAEITKRWFGRDISM